MVSSNTPATPSRRTFLKGAGSLALIGATAAACGGGKHLSQWYHQYGEKGTEQAAKKYAAAYKKEKVQVQWKPGDYGSARCRRRCSARTGRTSSSRSSISSTYRPSR